MSLHASNSAARAKTYFRINMDYVNVQCRWRQDINLWKVNHLHTSPPFTLLADPYLILAKSQGASILQLFAGED